MRPLLVSQRFVSEFAYRETRAALDVRWGSFLAEAGLLAVPVAPRVDPVTLVNSLADCAGVLLTGGNDLSELSKDPLSRARDEYETALLDAARALPVLGVCRGLQFFAQLDGLTLERVDGHAGTRHTVSASQDSPYLGRRGDFEVNSFHTWSIRGEPRSLRVAARTERGDIEALESTQGPPRLGIMWHPEREEPFNQADVALFKRFYEGVS